MKTNDTIDYFLVRECRTWDEFGCPHRSSITSLIDTIYDKNTVNLKDRLIKDLQNICEECDSYKSYSKSKEIIK